MHTLPPTTDRCVITHQIYSQRDHLLDIVSITILDMIKGITKATADNQSGKRYWWCTFLNHSGVEDKLLDRPTQLYQTLLMYSFESSVRQNHFGIKKKKIFCGIVKATVPDVYASFGVDTWCDLALDTSVQVSLIFQL